jgi:hypothetical protein
MKRVLLFAAFIFFLACDTPADFEAYQKYFVKFLGGEGSQEGVDMVVDGQGNFYILGTSTLDPVRQISKIYLAKTDSEGNLISEKIYFNDPGNEVKYVAKDLLLTNNGSLIVLGSIVNSATDRDICVLKVDLELSLVADEVVLSEDVDSDAVPEDEVGNSILELESGNLVIVGTTTNISPKSGVNPGDLLDNLQLLLTPDLVNITPPAWRQIYGRKGVDTFTACSEIDDNTLYMFGYNSVEILTEEGSLNFNVTAIASIGGGVPPIQTVDKRIGLDITDEILYSASESSFGTIKRILLSGISVDQTGSANIFVESFLGNLDSNPSSGNLLPIVLSEQIDRDIRNVTTTNLSNGSGFYLIANQQGTSVGERNILLTKIANDGTLAWPVPVIFGGEFDDTIGSVTELSDGSIVIVGTFGVGGNQKKIALLKVNAEGKFIE